MRFTRDDEPREKTLLQLLEQIKINCDVKKPHFLPNMISTQDLENEKNKSKITKKRTNKIHPRAK